MPRTIIQSGPHKVVWDPSGANVTFAKTTDAGIKLTLQTKHGEINIDQRAEEAVDDSYRGTKCLLEFESMEWDEDKQDVFWGEHVLDMLIGRMIVAGDFAKPIVMEPIDPTIPAANDGRPVARYTMPLSWPIGDKPVTGKTGPPPKTMPFAFKGYTDLDTSVSLERFRVLKIERWNGSGWTEET